MPTPVQRPVPLLLLALAVGPAVAQSPSFSLFGDGCRGSGNTACFGANKTFYRPGKSAAAVTRFAIQARPPVGSSLFGFELLTASLTGKPITINVAIHGVDNFFRPLPTPAAVGTMTIGVADAWYATQMTIPGILQNLGSNQPVYLVFEGTNQMKAPVVSGARASTGLHYTQAIGTSVWLGPHSNVAWAWRLMCIRQGPSIPSLSNLGLPRVGQGMAVTLADAPLSARAFLLFGVSRTVWRGGLLPFDMGVLGAPGCLLLASPDVLFQKTTSGLGRATVIVQVPNQPTLVGARYFNQWLVLDDPGANPLGIVVSPAAMGVIGR